ncbi:VOC family protein [Vallitalea okinawensis]|uniref:VOC family protein n=1 Tax=Vallitalea okinawensis TaxID=2078660 RepID=UPI000CFAE844|nr:VOC family protein [Vallitalea okinawensis]
MNDKIRYVHTNLIAEDWKRLASFYINIFGCKPIPPERNLSGKWLDDLTGISEVSIKGIHLSLPGYENGPTLEIFEYSPTDKVYAEKHINQMGFGHLAFHVDSVEVVLKKILKNGGGQLGEMVRKEYEGIGVLTAVYASDPEGNFIEIQNWSK